MPAAFAFAINCVYWWGETPENTCGVYRAKSFSSSVQSTYSTKRMSTEIFDPSSNFSKIERNYLQKVRERISFG